MTWGSINLLYDKSNAEAKVPEKNIYIGKEKLDVLLNKVI